ncbi:CPBP family intramembrane glutamic endopeptidase [Agaribacter flavus]|uniref:CPBP family intramembrane glutamic endopeptidase n=1 Tax=Agaribacter flavus TaxID=1902781 RepID=A0ABV7FRK9_9ALTE
MEININSGVYKAIELCLIFVVLPFFIAFNPIIYISIVLILVALMYLLVISKRIWGEGSWRAFYQKKIKPTLSRLLCLDTNALLKKYKVVLIRLSIMFILFAIGTSLFVYVTMPNELFHVVLNNTFLWLAISVFYSLFSVLPQEFLYRSFFFTRYQSLVPNHAIFILLNAVIFCLAHLMFFNTLVMILTFCGGLLFAYTYHVSRSFWLVSVEHSLYGVWLYTVGMGAMLAFPSG